MLFAQNNEDIFFVELNVWEISYVMCLYVHALEHALIRALMTQKSWACSRDEQLNIEG